MCSGLWHGSLTYRLFMLWTNAFISHQSLLEFLSQINLKQTFPNYLLTPMSSKMFMSSVVKKLSFLRKRFHDFIYPFIYHIVEFNGCQRVEGPNCSFDAASKGSTRSQLRNDGLF